MIQSGNDIHALLYMDNITSQTKIVNCLFDVIIQIVQNNRTRQLINSTNMFTN